MTEWICWTTDKHDDKHDEKKKKQPWSSLDELQEGKKGWLELVTVSSTWPWKNTFETPRFNSKKKKSPTILSYIYWDLFFHINLKMFTETVPSICIAMESNAMSIECKKKKSIKWCKYQCSTHTWLLFFLIQITLYKNEWDLLICSEAALKIQDGCSDVSARQC